MSGRKNTLPSFQNITNQDMSMSYTSVATNIQELDDVGIQITWSGASPGGTVTFQVSADAEIDNNGNIIVAGDWATVQNPPGTDITVVPTGTSGTTYVDFALLSAPYIRVVYTTAGGSVGTLNSYITAKMV